MVESFSGETTSKLDVLLCLGVDFFCQGNRMGT